MNYTTGHQQADKKLVQRVLDGDTYAFAAIVKNTERLVALIIFKMISRAADRKDIAQDIFIKVFRDLPNFRFESKLSTWVGQVTYFTCLKYLEKKQLVLVKDYGEEYETASQDIEQLLHKKETREILANAIENLPPVYKTLISLFHQEEMSYEEIVNITGLPDGTVKSYLSRARKQLKANLLANYKREEL